METHLEDYLRIAEELKIEEQNTPKELKPVAKQNSKDFQS